MTWTITGSGTHTPLQILQYQSAQASRNAVNATLGGDLEIQLADATEATGSFRALFSELSDALACRSDVAQGHLLTVVDDEDADLSMTFVLAEGGRAVVEANMQAAVWELTIDFQEVPA